MNLSCGERPVCGPVRTTSGPVGGDHALAGARSRARTARRRRGWSGRLPPRPRALGRVVCGHRHDRCPRLRRGRRRARGGFADRPRVTGARPGSRLPQSRLRFGFGDCSRPPSGGQRPKVTVRMAGRGLCGPAAGAGSGPVERLAQVRDEVVGVLDADRQPDERRVDRERRSGDREVGHRGRHLDQRLDAAQRLGEREQPRRLADRDGPLAPPRPCRPPAPARTRPCRRTPASPSASGARRPRARGARGGRRRGPDSRPRRRRRGRRGTGRRPMALAQWRSIAQGERPQAAQDQEAVERPGHAAHRVLEEAQPLGDGVVARDRDRRGSRPSARRGTWSPSGTRCRRRARAGAGGPATRTCCRRRAAAAPARLRRRARGRSRRRAAMSMTLSSGFDGVSNQTRRVRSVRRLPQRVGVRREVDVARRRRPPGRWTRSR